MRATVVATMLSSYSFNVHVFYTFYFRSQETVCQERHVSYGSEQLKASARVMKLAAGLRAVKRVCCFVCEV